MGFRVKARGSQEIIVTGMSTGAGDMARQSEPEALPQDLGLGLSTHDVQFTTACNPSSKDSDALFWHLWPPTLICTRTTETREKKILNANESSKFSYDDFGAPPPPQHETFNYS